MSFDKTTYGSAEITLSSSSTTSPVLIARKVLFSKVHHAVDITVDSATKMVNITMSGPSDKWFGIGFGRTMMDGAYSIICSTDHDVCFEQLLGAGTVGQIFPQQLISTTSDTTKHGVRTVELRRKQTVTRDDDNNYAAFYDFPSSPTAVPVLYSYGTNGLFVQNQSHMADAGASALTFSNETGRTNLSAKAVLFKTVREYPPRNDPVHQDVAVHVLPDEDTVQIIMSGPHDVWFGVGFGSDTMNGTYAVIADTANTVREYILSAESFGI